MAESEEKKLGPNAVYQPEDETRKEPVTVQGVQFVPGKSVNVIDRLGEQKGQEALKKLSQNQFFNVEGGTDWKAEAQKKAQAEEQEAKDLEEARKAQAESESQTPQPPEDWKGPDKAELETDSGARRPTMPQSGSRRGGSSRSGGDE